MPYLSPLAPMLPTLFVLGLATCLSTLVGGFVILRSREGQHYWFAFAAGSLIAVSFLDLLPESLAEGAASGLAARTLLSVVVGSFLLYSVVDRFFLTHHLHDDDAHGHPLGWIGAGSLVVHSCLDGVAIAAAFRAGAAVGAVVATAVIVHDASDGLNTVVLMRKNGQPPARVNLFLVMDAVAPLVGIGAASLAAPGGRALAVLLAFFCGEFLYLGAGSLLPETREGSGFGAIGALAAGMLLVFVAGWFV